MIETHLEELQLREELLRRRKAPINTYVPCSHPERNQLAFHKSSAFIRLATGGNQSGKTILAAWEASQFLLGTHPYQPMPKAAKVWAISSTYRTIVEGIWRHLNPVSAETGAGAGFLPPHSIVKKGPNVPGWDIPSYLQVRNKQGYTSHIDFISGEGTESARQKTQAAAVDLVLIDEEIDEIIWNEILMRTLARKGRIIVTATMVRSEEWILELERRAESGDKNVFMVRLNTEFNEHLDPESVQQAFAGMSQEEIEVRKFGRSRRTQGLVYPEFGSQHIVEPFKIPKEWPRYCALDPGFRTFAGLWVATAPNGESFAYRELYVHNAVLHEVAEAIYKMEGCDWDPVRGTRIIHDTCENIEHRYIDPAAFSHAVSGEVGIGCKLAAEFDLPCIPASNAVAAGIESVRTWLQPGLTGNPGFRVFNTCVAFLKERSKYKFVPENSSQGQHERPDKPLKKGDHLMDCWRYLAARIVGPVEGPPIIKKVNVPFASVSAEEKYQDYFSRIMKGRDDANRYGW